PRERIELSLDDRQVIALGVCALLLLSGVFVVGVLLGRKLSAAPPPSIAGDLAALDAQARKPTARPEPAAARPAVAPPLEKAPETVVKDEPVQAISLAPPPPRPATVVAAPAQPTKAPPPPVAVLSPPPRDPGHFTLHAGASQDRADAVRLEARAGGAGLKPYVVEASLGAKGTWYRVRVGSFRDKESAGRYRTDVERELRTAAVVMPTH